VLSVSVSPPTEDEVARVVGIVDPVVRNLQITYTYSRLSSAVAERTGSCSNWCTFATWASRQAGATIRGEDFLDALRRRLGRMDGPQHPIRSLWRALLRRGVFRAGTRLGRLVRAIHTPFDAFERTSDAVARGNLKVFDEIGRAFARWLSSCPRDAPVDSPEFTEFLRTLTPGEPPDGQDYLRRAFTCYQQQAFETNAGTRAELLALGNLQIGLHEQTRLQPDILESLDAPLVTARDLRARLVHVYSGGFWRILARSPLGSTVLAVATPFRRFAERLSREVITDCLMVLSLPDGAALRLGRPLGFPIPAPLQTPSHPDFMALRTRFEHCTPQGAVDAEDWADLDQRMHFILHLFCAFGERADLFSPPFTDDQVTRLLSGRLPAGRL